MIKTIIYSILGTLLFAACDHVEIIVTDIPANTPEGSPMYISGNFNFWDPGDERFKLYKEADGYHAHIPKGFGQLEFKFTRGDWTTVETSTCGEDIENRVWNDDETVAKFTIKGWRDLDAVDCGKTVIALSQVPDSTPANARLYLFGSINGYKVGDYRYQFKEDSAGVYFVAISKQHQQFECLINRGSEATIEADKFGFLSDWREIVPGNSDTIWVGVENWADFVAQKPSVTVIASVPDILNKEDKIYFACDANEWNPSNENYKFTAIGPRKYAFSMPLESKVIYYKLTLGDWGTVECNSDFGDIDNRLLQYAGKDTIYISVDQFKNRATAKK